MFNSKRIAELEKRVRELEQEAYCTIDWAGGVRRTVGADDIERELGNVVSIGWLVRHMFAILGLSAERVRSYGPKINLK